jgi:hypothetical protein
MGTGKICTFLDRSSGVKEQQRSESWSPPSVATMDITGRKKKNPRSTLFEKLNLQKNKRENNRTSLPLAAGHRGCR